MRLSVSSGVTSARVASPAGLARPAMMVPARRPQRLMTVSRKAPFVCHAVDSAKVIGDVRSIIAEQLGKDLDTVTPDAKFSDLGADSLDTVEIMMALEEKFEITLEEEGAEKIATVQDAADLIAGQIDN